MLFAKLRAAGLGREAAACFQESGWAAAEKAIAAAKPGLRAGAWAHLGAFLHNEGHAEEARQALQRALGLEPDRSDVLLFLAELADETGDTERACALYDRLVKKHPTWEAAAAPLGRLLLARGEPESAVEVLERIRGSQLMEPKLILAKALFEVDRHEDVVALLEPLVMTMRNELRNLFGGPGRAEVVSLLEEASRLHDESYAYLHGREQVIESALHIRELDARAGVNYRLLGEARMASPLRWTPDLQLRSIEESIAFGESLCRQGEASRGLCQLGAADLRRGRLPSARRLFERAREADDDNFAAYLGLGATLDYGARRVFRRVAQLGKATALPPAGLLDIVTDWPALTVLERAAVIAAAAPLASLLPGAAAAGGQARILPIDARPVDLQQMSAEAGTRDAYDERVIDAITGLANEEVCVSKIESLLDIGSQGGWVFAHELAHLLHFHAPPSVQEQLESLWQLLQTSGYVLESYQTKNVHEFFAVAYVDYLDRLYDLPRTREEDESGLMQQVFDYLGTLG